MTTVTQRILVVMMARRRMLDRERRALLEDAANKQWMNSLPRHILLLGENTFSLFVSNIPEDSAKPELEAIFWRAGKIRDSFIPIDKISGKTRGFAFVRFGSLKEAENAVELAHGRLWRGRKIQVQKATFKQDVKASCAVLAKHPAGSPP